jgi:GR25 family glycosyltransferase involved in LPS biosynthesis
MKTYCICMPSETERRNRVERQFQEQSLDVEFVEGVNGKTLTKAEVRANASEFMQYFGHPGTLGCAMSHIKCWMKAQEEDLDEVMICESDVKICDNFQSKLDNIMTELREQNDSAKDTSYDVLYLGTVEFNPTKPLGKGWVLYRSFVNMGYRERQQLTNNVWRPDISLATHCYVVTRVGYTKLLSEIKGRINGHIDHQMMLLADKVKYLCVYPNLATQVTTQSVSSINDTRFPNVINTLMDSPSDGGHHFSNAYILNCPVARICGYDLNWWSVIYIIVGVIILFVGASDSSVLLIYAMFVFLNSLPLPTFNKRGYAEPTGSIADMCHHVMANKLASGRVILAGGLLILLPSKIYKFFRG